MELLGSTQQIIIAAALGYIGYWFAYHGFSNEKEDRLYKTLLFGILPLCGLKLIDQYYLNIWCTLVIVIVMAIINICIGIFWRKNGKDLLFKLLNKTKVSNENNIDTVLNEINQSEISKSIMIVYLKNGTVYESTLAKHKDLPFGPCRIDKEGGILMYIDEVTLPNDKQSTTNEIETSETDVTITYIAKDEIKSIDFTIKNK